MVVPVRRRLQTKTPPAAAQRVPSMGLVRRRMRSKGPPSQPQPQPQVPAGSGGVLGTAQPGGGGDPPVGDGQPGSGGRPLRPPGLPLQAPAGPPGDGGDSGGDDGATAQDTDQDFYDKQHRRPPEDPDSSGDDGAKGRQYRNQTPVTINKWAKRPKPLPKLELPSTSTSPEGE